MAENDNGRAHDLHRTPHPALKTLERLVGTWTIRGPHVEGRTTFEWMEGGFFLIRRFQMNHDGVIFKGIEYTGFDDATQSLRSHLVDTRGVVQTYTWEVDGDTVCHWVGDKGSANYSRGTFSTDGNTITGRWQWPNEDGRLGSYEYIKTRLR